MGLFKVFSLSRARPSQSSNLTGSTTTNIQRRASSNTLIRRMTAKISRLREIPVNDFNISQTANSFASSEQTIADAQTSEADDTHQKKEQDSIVDARKQSEDHGTIVHEGYQNSQDIPANLSEEDILYIQNKNLYKGRVSQVKYKKGEKHSPRRFERRNLARARSEIIRPNKGTAAGLQRSDSFVDREYQPFRRKSLPNLNLGSRRHAIYQGTPSSNGSSDGLHSNYAAKSESTDNEVPHCNNKTTSSNVQKTIPSSRFTSSFADGKENMRSEEGNYECEKVSFTKGSDKFTNPNKLISLSEALALNVSQEPFIVSKAAKLSDTSPSKNCHRDETRHHNSHKLATASQSKINCPEVQSSHSRQLSENLQSQYVASSTDLDPRVRWASGPDSIAAFQWVFGIDSIKAASLMDARLELMGVGPKVFQVTIEFSNDLKEAVQKARAFPSASSAHDSITTWIPLACDAKMTADNLIKKHPELKADFEPLKQQIDNQNNLFKQIMLGAHTHMKEQIDILLKAIDNEADAFKAKNKSIETVYGRLTIADSAMQVAKERNITLQGQVVQLEKDLSIQGRYINDYVDRAEKEKNEWIEKYRALEREIENRKTQTVNETSSRMASVARADGIQNNPNLPYALLPNYTEAQRTAQINAFSQLARATGGSPSNETGARVFYSNSSDEDEPNAVSSTANGTTGANNPLTIAFYRFQKQALKNLKAAEKEGVDDDNDDDEGDDNEGDEDDEGAKPQINFYHSST